MSTPLVLATSFGSGIEQELGSQDYLYLHRGPVDPTLIFWNLSGICFVTVSQCIVNSVIKGFPSKQNKLHWDIGPQVLEYSYS